MERQSACWSKGEAFSSMKEHRLPVQLAECCSHWLLSMLTGAFCFGCIYFNGCECNLSSESSLFAQ